MAVNPLKIAAPPAFMHLGAVAAASAPTDQTGPAEYCLELKNISKSCGNGTHKTMQIGNMVQAMQAYACGELGQQPVPLADADRIIAIGSDRMMAAVAMARHTVLKPFLKTAHEAIGSINSPMQCMMKEICAQCLQRHIDPVTGEVRYVFFCLNQNQPLDAVDWNHLNQRLRQNGVQEKLSAQWIALCRRQATQHDARQAEATHE